jgi:hypothetical protein
VFGRAPLKALVSFFLRISPSPLMSLEKKAKTPETQIHEDDLPCIFRVSFPSAALLSLGLLSFFNFMWAKLLWIQGYGFFFASDFLVRYALEYDKKHEKESYIRNGNETPREALPFDAASSRASFL